MEEGLAQVIQTENLNNRRVEQFIVGMHVVWCGIDDGLWSCDCRLFQIMKDNPIAGGVPGDELNFCGHIRAVIQRESQAIPVVGVKAAPLPPKQTVEELAKRVPFQGGFGRRKFREE